MPTTRFGSPNTLGALALGTFALAGASCALLAGVEDAVLRTDTTSTSNTTGGGGTAHSGGGGTSAGGGGGSTTTTGGGGSGATGGMSYADEVLLDAPLAYWRLGEDTTPTAFDATGNGHDGTYQSVTLSEPGAIAGDADTACRFSGPGSLVIIGDVFGFEGQATFSAEAWVKPTIAASSIFGKATWNEIDQRYEGWFVYHSETATTMRRALNVAGPSLAADEFTHLVVTYDGVTQALYVNGQLADQRVNNETVPVHGDPMTLGQMPNWVAFEGILDEVAIYDTNLPPARILAHYEVGTGQR